MKKIKKLLTGGLLGLIILFVSSLLGTSKVYAAADPSNFKSNITFKSYYASDYDAYANYDYMVKLQAISASGATPNFDIDLVTRLLEDIGYDMEDGVYTSFDEAYADYITGSRYRNKNFSSFTYDELVQASVNELPTQTTTFVPGDEIVIEAYNEITNTPNYIKSNAVAVDITSINDSTYPNSFYLNKSAGIGTTNSSIKTVDSVTMAIFGFDYSSASVAYSSGVTNACTGAVKLKIKSDATSTNISIVQIPNAQAGQTLIGTTDGTLISTYGYSTTHQAKYNVSPLSLTIAGATPNTDINDLTVAGTNVVSSGTSGVTPSSTTVGSSSYDTYDCSGITALADGVSNGTFNIGGSVGDGGSITSVTYGPTANAAITSGTAASGNHSTGYTVNVSDTTTYPTGGEVWAAVNVAASDGTTKTYLIKVDIKESSDNTLASLSATYNGTTLTGTINNTANTITFANSFAYADVSTFDLNFVVNNSNIQSVKIGTANPGTTPVTLTGTPAVNGSYNGSFTTTSTTKYNEFTVNTYITVKAQDGTEKTYTVTFKRAKANETAAISGLTITNANGTRCELYNSGNTSAATFSSGPINYTLRITSDVTTLNVTPTFVSPNTVDVNGTSATSGSSIAVSVSGNSFTVIVYAENPTKTKTYTFTYYTISAVSTISSDPILQYSTNNTNLTLDSYDSSTKTYNYSGLPYKYNSFTFNVALGTGQSAKLAISGTTTTIPNSTATIINFNTTGYGSVTNTYTLTVTSAAGTTTDYLIKVTRDKASEDTTLDGASVSYNGSTQIGQFSSSSISLNNKFTYNTATGYQVTTTLHNDVQKIAIGNTTNPSGNTSGTFNGNFGTGVGEQTATVYILVKAENPSFTQEYVLTIVREKADDNKTIDTLSVKNSSGSEVGTWNSVTQSYTVSATDQAYSITGITASVSLPNGSLAKVTINSYNVTSKTLSYSSAARQSVSFEIIVTAQDNTTNTINIEVYREGADNTSTFTIVASANGGSVSTTTVGTLTSTTVNLPYNTTSVNYTITPTVATTDIYIGSTLITDVEQTYTFPVVASLYNGDTSIKIVTQASSVTGSSITHTIRFVRDAAENIKTLTATQVIYDITGTQITLGSQSGSSYTYELVAASATDGNYYIDATATSSKAKIYTTTNQANFGNLSLMDEYTDSTTPYAIGTDLYLVVYSEYGLVSPGPLYYTVFTIKTSYTDTRHRDPSILSIVATSDSSSLPSNLFTFGQSTETYTFSVPFGITKIGFEVVLNDSLASLLTTTSSATSALNNKTAYNDSTGTTYKNLNEGLNVIYIQARAENSSIKGSVYVFNITREAALTDDYMTSLTINGENFTSIVPGKSTVEFSSYTNSFDVVLPRTVVQANISFNLSSKASFDLVYDGTSRLTGSAVVVAQSYRATLVQGAKNTITISVKSEKTAADGGAANIYNINIYTADQNFAIDNIELLDQAQVNQLVDLDGSGFTFNSTLTTQPTFNVAYKVSGSYALVTTNSIFANVSGDGIKNLTINGDTTYTIVVKSEYATLNSSVTNQKTTITIKIHRDNADYTDTLDTLSVKIDGVEMLTGFTSTNTGPYQILNVPETATQVTFAATKTSDLSEVNPDKLGTFTLDLSAHSSELYTIEVKSEACISGLITTYKTYQIRIVRLNVVLDSDPSISNITAIDSNSTSHLSYLATRTSYTINLPASVNQVVLVATPTLMTTSVKYTIDTLEETTYSKTVSLNAGATKVVTISSVAQDGTALAVPYTITINRAEPSHVANLDSISFNGTPIDNFISTEYNYKVNVTNDVETAVLTYTKTNAEATVTLNEAPSDSPYSLRVGDNLIQIMILAEDGSTTRTYSITVVRDDVTTLSSLTISKPGSTDNLIVFVDGTYEYTVTDHVLFTTDSLNLSALTNGTNTKVTVSNNGADVFQSTNGSIPLAEGTNEIIISVEAASGFVTEYKVTIVRENGLTGNSIVSYTKEDGNSLDDINNTDTTYTYVVPRSVDIFAPVIVPSNGATVTLPTATALTIGKNTMNVTVTSETGAVKTYTFFVYRNEAISDITDISVLDSANADIVDLDSTSVAYDKDTIEYTLRVSYSVTSIYLSVETLGDFAKTYVNSSLYPSITAKNLAVGLNRFEIYAVSEYGEVNTSAINQKSTVYIIKVTRESANNDTTLSSLKVMNGGVDLLTTSNSSATFNPTTMTYTIQNVENISSVNILAIANSVTSTVSGHVGNQPLQQLSDAENGYVFTFRVEVTCEDTTAPKGVYTIVISRGPINLDADNEISYIVVTDSAGKEYLGQATFDSDTIVYPFEMPFNIQSYTIQIVKATSVSPAVPYGTGQTQVTSADYGNTKNHTVYLKSEDGIDGVKYTIKVSITEPSDNNYLSDIRIEGVTIPGFNKEVLSYNYGTVSNATTSLTLNVTLDDPKSTYTITNPVLVEGPNTISIAVKAENNQTKVYTITVIRDYPLPYLTNLNVVGEKLLDESDKATTFDKDTLTYHVVVTYLVLQAKISASVDVKSHSIVVSNSSFSATESTDNNRIFTSSLNEGANYFYISVVSIEGKTQNYTLVIVRNGLASTNTNVDINHPVDIEQLPDFSTDYSNLNTSYGTYVLPFGVTNVGDISLTLENGAASYEVFNDNLHVGSNRVIVLITAEDGESTRAIIINVVREDMEISINEDAYENYKPVATEKKNVYTIDLVDKKASEISDYTKFLNISTSDLQAANVEVLSDTSRDDCNEVVIRVTDVNGSSSQTYTFQLSSTAINSNPGISIWVWISLVVVVILLIIILICVNRDKYGSILKKRKKASR